mmetsp:Transcript_33905/g.46432  ORF Transcript_33905/g.46432 Transcript_33905/m.46432 type:complete len:297 (+) Transcript_33905:1-891(+)
MAGAVSDSIVHPMDTTRCLLQLHRNPSDRWVKKGSISSKIRSIIRENGIRGMYRGFGVVLSCSVPAHALYFMGYEATKDTLGHKELFGKKLGTDNPSVHFVSGMTAELGGALVWGPMDVIKQRAQSSVDQVSSSHHRNSAQQKETWKIFRSILANEGPTGLYKGFSAALLVYVPFMGIYFSTYEHLKSRATPFFSKTSQNSTPDLPFPVHLCSAASAGGIAAALTSPLDIVKTRLQVESSTTPNRYMSVGDALSRIMKEEGIQAFGKGLGARVLWVMPGTALSMTAFETFKKWNFV